MDTRRQYSPAVVGAVLVLVAVGLVVGQQLLSDGSTAERAAQLGAIIAVVTAAWSRRGAGCVPALRRNGAARRR